MPPNLKPGKLVLAARVVGRWDPGLWDTHRLLETLLVRAVTEASDTESGSSPSPSRMARWSRSSISSTAGSSGEEGKSRRVDAELARDCLLRRRAKFQVYLMALA